MTAADQDRRPLCASFGTGLLRQGLHEVRFERRCRAFPANAGGWVIPFFGRGRPPTEAGAPKSWPFPPAALEEIVETPPSRLAARLAPPSPPLCLRAPADPGPLVGHGFRHRFLRRRAGKFLSLPAVVSRGSSHPFSRRGRAPAHKGTGNGQGRCNAGDVLKSSSIRPSRGGTANFHPAATTSSPSPGSTKARRLRAGALAGGDDPSA